MAGELNGSGARRTRRCVAATLLVLAVLLAHAWVARKVDASMAGWGAAATMPERIAVAFVRELKPAPAPPPPVAAPPPKPRRKAKPRAPSAPAAAASQPAAVAAQKAASETIAQATSPASAASEPVSSEFAASEPSSESLPAPSPTEPPLQTSAIAAADAASAPAIAVAKAQAASAPATEPPIREWPSQWPASTRLHYTLTGWYRGEVHGSASVDWLREGSRYQVHLDVTVGAPFAPLMSRRMSSDGELTDAGLKPHRYDEETKVAFREPRQATIRFDDDAVILPGGHRRARWAGVQDAASQFVQLTWLFTTDPSRLMPGATLEVPLALPRSVDRWRYDVLDAEELRLPFGTLPVRHLKPQRTTRPTGDMVIEVWFAPTLLYLPVRIRIHQDAETFVDLLIDRPPLQGEGCGSTSPCADVDGPSGGRSAGRLGATTE